MKKIFVALLITSGFVKAQDATFTLFQQNLNDLNPALVGTSKNSKAGITYKDKLIGISGGSSLIPTGTSINTWVEIPESESHL